MKLWPVVLLMMLDPTAAAPSAGRAPGKLALIVAISAYPPGSGYGRLNARDDVALVRSGLEAQGFGVAGIRVLEDSAATREGILGGLAWLTRQVGPGDAVVVHYSGHGHQISDDNGDELDGLDEVLVPYGAPGLPRAGGAYRGERHIRDDELAPLLAALRARVGAGGSVTVFIDACYSGSATRGGPGEPAIRGGGRPLVVAGSPTRREAPGSDVASGAFEPGTRGTGASGLGALVVISAARHDQLAHETYDANRNPVGALSLALARTLPELKAGATYRALFDRLAVAMSGMRLYDQQPQIEGTVDAQVFGGAVVEQVPYHAVTRASGDSLVYLRGGVLVGLLPGTRVALYPAGTTDPAGASPLAQGTVREANGTLAEVAVASPPVAASLAGSWAFVTEYALGSTRVRVRIDPAMPGAARETARQLLEETPVADVVTATPDLQLRGAGNGLVELVTVPGGIPLGPPSGPGSPALREQLTTHARSVALRQVELRDPRIVVRLELVRTAPRLRTVMGELECTSTPPVPVPDQGPSAEGMVMAPGDEYTLRLVNDGPDPAYVSILELGPLGRVDQLYPAPGALGSDNLLLPGRSHLVQDACFWVEEPHGVAVIKLFATRERLDFTPILSPAGASRGEPLSPLGRLLAAAAQGTRSGVLASASSGSTAAVTITIKPRPRAP